MSAVLAVCAKTLGDRRRSLVGWSVGVVAATLMIMALWPTMRDLSDLERLVESYPAEFRELFGVDAMTTPAGFFSAEYMSLLGPLLFLVFAIALGARLPAAEEERGSLEVVLATPVPRVRLLAGQALALVAAVTALGVVQLGAMVTGTVLFDASIPAGRMVAGTLALVLLGIELGLFALLVGAGTGRRALGLAVASSVAALLYLAYVAAQFVEVLQPWRALTPFEQAVGSQPLLAGLGVGAAAALAVPGVLAVLAALPLFARRDLAAA